MTAKMEHIPTEVYLDFLSRTIEIHWNYHALLMVGIWLVLVPIGIISIRFFKPWPTERGIENKIRIKDPQWAWFQVHKLILYLAVGLSLAGVLVAVVVSKGFSGSVHSIFGLATIGLGCLQVFSSWLRGKHGGRFYNNANPNDPTTWHGDSFNMTQRRRLFETYHKSAGYFAAASAMGAIGSGLMQYSMPGLAIAVMIGGIGIIIVVMVLEYLGWRQDSYLATFGYHPENPHNIARKYPEAELRRLRK